MKQKVCCRMVVSALYGIEVGSAYGLLQARATGEGRDYRPCKLPFRLIITLTKSTKRVIYIHTLLGSEEDSRSDS